jgi:hypothetical protein
MVASAACKPPCHVQTRQIGAQAQAWSVACAGGQSGCNGCGTAAQHNSDHVAGRAAAHHGAGSHGRPPGRHLVASFELKKACKPRMYAFLLWKLLLQSSVMAAQADTVEAARQPGGPSQDDHGDKEISRAIHTALLGSAHVCFQHASVLAHPGSWLSSRYQHPLHVQSCMRWAAALPAAPAATTQSSSCWTQRMPCWSAQSPQSRRPLPSCKLPQVRGPL